MNIFEYFRKKGIDTVDASFYAKIAEWTSWYQSNVKKFHFYRVYGGRGTYTRCRRHSMGMAKKVSQDVADLLLNEKVTITLADEKTDKYVKKVLSDAKFSTMGNEYQERKAAKGTVAYVPYLVGEVTEEGEIVNGEVKINYLDAPNIFPMSWENGVVKECAFVFPKVYRQKNYAHIQFHKLEAGQYVIENTVVECTRGAGTELTKEEWRQIPAFADLTDRIETGSKERQFVIDRLNIVNNADEDGTNPMGIAIFANSIDTLRKLDLEYDSYANEFSLGRKRIFVAPEMLSDKNGNPTFDSNDTVFYQLPEDYMTNAKDPIKEVNMELRTEAHSKAINDDLNYLSFKCGFGTERYKFDGGNITTATQVISENSDLYRSIVKHELILSDVLKELIRIIIRLGIAANTPGLKLDTEITIAFDDSIIEDKKSERQDDRQDVSMGVMRLEEYRAKWYGETLEEAAKKLPEPALTEE